MLSFTSCVAGRSRVFYRHVGWLAQANEKRVGSESETLAVAPVLFN